MVRPTLRDLSNGVCLRNGSRLHGTLKLCECQECELCCALDRRGGRIGAEVVGRGLSALHRPGDLSQRFERLPLDRCRPVRVPSRLTPLRRGIVRGAGCSAGWAAVGGIRGAPVWW